MEIMLNNNSCYTRTCNKQFVKNILRLLIDWPSDNLVFYMSYHLKLCRLGCNVNIPLTPEGEEEIFPLGCKFPSPNTAGKSF